MLSDSSLLVLALCRHFTDYIFLSFVVLEVQILALNYCSVFGLIPTTTQAETTNDKIKKQRNFTIIITIATASDTIKNQLKIQCDAQRWKK